MSFIHPAQDPAGLPLASLSAIVLDTETTGLDARNDRVVEIGAVRLHAGERGDDGHSVLVDPAILIPPASTAIHGITDADTAGAPTFPAAMAAFAEWAGSAVVIGYATAFDIAVLRHEHERHGLVWREPRTLDVRELAEALGPDLPDWSLETLAGWLGVQVEGRHRARVDAQLARSVFRALIPRLRTRGVSTLAEAERFCRRSRSRADIAISPVRSTAEYARIDSFPYRHRVGDVMNSPPLVIAPGATLAEALARMTTERVGALLIAADAGGAPGIVTERDILRALHARGGAALSDRVGDAGSSPLVTVGRNEFVYRALVTMAVRGFRHLGVTGDNGALVGALSARDLLRQRAEDAVSLGHEIEAAVTPAHLGRIWSGLAAVARTLIDERVDARDIAAIISRELRALTCRACEIAETELVAGRLGPPPEPYAMLVLGSGGRGESLLAMDQDNAIVLREGPPGSAAADWCRALGRRVADILDEAGVSYCQGGVMAANAEWRRDLAGWRTTVADWLARTRSEDVLNADIFFDAVPVYGDFGLADRLCGESLAAARSARPFLHMLAQNAARFDRPVGWFGRPRLEKGRIDLKKGGVMPLFSAARVVALRHAVPARSTAERLRAAKALGEVPDRVVDDLLAAHGILLELILQQQLRDLERGLSLSNRVSFADLGNQQRRQLAWALDRLPCIADLVKVPLPI